MSGLADSVALLVDWVVGGETWDAPTLRIVLRSFGVAVES